MKIAVKNIKPTTSFRNIENYPIDRAKVDFLKANIQETDFWDNILLHKKGKITNWQMAIIALWFLKNSASMKLTFQ